MNIVIKIIIRIGEIVFNVLYRKEDSKLFIGKWKLKKVISIVMIREIILFLLLDILKNVIRIINSNIGIIVRIRFIIIVFKLKKWYL